MAGKKVQVERLQVVALEDGKRWAVPSGTRDGVVYQVELSDDRQTLSCNCPAGWNGRMCKHKRAVVMVEKLEDAVKYDPDSAKKNEKPKETKGGYRIDEVASALQKSIRKGSEEQALFWALELYETAPYYVWKRIEVTAAEDIGLADLNTVVMVSQCHQAWDLCKRYSWYVSPHHLTLAVLLLCRAPKSTEVEDMQSLYLEMRAKGWRIKVPNYALDGHTAKGRASGQKDNWEPWFRFRHEVCGIPINKWTKKLAEFNPSWFGSFIDKVLGEKDGDHEAERNDSSQG